MTTHFSAAAARFGDDPRVIRARDVIGRVGAPAISVLVLFAALLAMRGIDYRSALAMVPRNPLFWLVLALTYFTPVACDWVIYHRIWRLPLAGLAPLTRKVIGNELVFGYVGDAYLFAWARQRKLIDAGAVKQIKDAAILSAAASNTTTILFALLAAPFAAMVGLHVPVWIALGGGLVILTPAIVALTLRNRIFSLPARDLRMILAMHGVRAIAGALLLSLLWHLALPTVALHWWLLFAAMKLVLSRMPFMSNKDLVLAGVTAALFGRHADVATLLAMVATLMTAMHIAVGLVLSARDAIDGAVVRLQRGAGSTAAPIPAYA